MVSLPNPIKVKKDFFSSDPKAPATNADAQAQRIADGKMQELMYRGSSRANAAQHASNMVGRKL